MVDMYNVCIDLCKYIPKVQFYSQFWQTIFLYT